MAATFATDAPDPVAGLWPAAGKHDAERGAVAWSGFGLNPSAVGLGYRPGDGEAEAAAPAIARAAAIESVKPLEDLFELVRRDLVLAVGDRDLEPVTPRASEHGHAP